MVDTSSFRPIATRFHANMGALRVQSAQMSESAEDYDKTKLSQLAQDIGRLTGSDSMENEQELLALIEDSDVEVEPLPDEAKIAELKALQDNALRDLTDLAQPDPEKVRQWLHLMNSFMKQPPVRGRLLRRSALISLVSHFEFLLGDLLRAYTPSVRHIHNSPLAPTQPDDRESIFETADTEREHEIADVMRQGLKKRLKRLSMLLGVEFDLVIPNSFELKEIIARRNLLVHANGNVNKAYLEQVNNPQYFRENQISEGLYLNVTRDYLQRATNIVQVTGLCIVQLCWRQWHKGEHNLADQSVAEFVYDLLVDERYDSVVKLAKFAANLDMGEDARVRIVINRAIALRDTGQRSLMQQLLIEESRDDKALVYESAKVPVKIALRMLREEYDAVLHLLPITIAEGQIDRLARRWPLFKPLWTNEKFIEAFANPDPK